MYSNTNNKREILGLRFWLLVVVVVVVHRRKVVGQEYIYVQTYILNKLWISWKDLMWSQSAIHGVLFTSSRCYHLKPINCWPFVLYWTCIHNYKMVVCNNVDEIVRRAQQKIAQVVTKYMKKVFSYIFSLFFFKPTKK